MKSFSFPAASILLILACIGFFATGSFAYELSKFYPLQQGNAWDYLVSDTDGAHITKARVAGEEPVNGINTIKITYMPQNDSEYVFFDSEALKMAKDSGSDGYNIYLPPYPIISDLELNNPKEYLSKIESYDANVGKGSETNLVTNIKLEAIEEIIVPAGTFSDCLKFSLLFKETNNGSTKSISNCYVWFAPGVGKAKELCQNTEYDDNGKESVDSSVEELTYAFIDGKGVGNPSPE